MNIAKSILKTHNVQVPSLKRIHLSSDYLMYIEMYVNIARVTLVFVHIMLFKYFHFPLKLYKYLHVVAYKCFSNKQNGRNFFDIQHLMQTLKYELKIAKNKFIRLE